MIATFLILIAWFFRDYLQADMATHMLIQIPLITLSGVFAANSISNSKINRHIFYKSCLMKLKPYNQLGLSGFLIITLVGMYWMLPKALDQVMISEYAQLSKFTSLFVAGLLLPWSYRKSHTVIRLFFIGGFCWALAIVGLLYQETDTRLCNFYLLNDQHWAGRGLVALAIILPIIWGILENIDRKKLRNINDIN